MKDTQSKTLLNQDQMHRACLVDEKGNEVPITQDMIDRAAQALEKCLSPFACYQNSTAS